MLFVDYQTALDSLQRAWIWKELKARELSSNFINIIKEGYEDFSCRVLHEGHLSKKIKKNWDNSECCVSQVSHFCPKHS
jgi:hypothetical protein